MIPDNLITPYGDIVHLTLFVDVEPISYTEACKQEVWQKAIEEKIEAIERNIAWNLATCLASKKPIVVKRVYKVKHLLDGFIAKYKARLVAKGFL